MWCCTMDTEGGGGGRHDREADGVRSLPGEHQREPRGGTSAWKRVGSRALAASQGGAVCWPELYSESTTPTRQKFLHARAPKPQIWAHSSKQQKKMRQHTIRRDSIYPRSMPIAPVNSPSSTSGTSGVSPSFFTSVSAILIYLNVRVRCQKVLCSYRSASTDCCHMCFIQNAWGKKARFNHIRSRS